MSLLPFERCRIHGDLPLSLACERRSFLAAYRMVVRLGYRSRNNCADYARPLKSKKDAD